MLPYPTTNSGQLVYSRRRFVSSSAMIDLILAITCMRKEALSIIADLHQITRAGVKHAGALHQLRKALARAQQISIDLVKRGRLGW